MADINSFDDIFNSDEFGLLNTQNEEDIHTLKNVPKVEKRADADFVARRENLMILMLWATIYWLSKWFKS